MDLDEHYGNAMKSPCVNGNVFICHFEPVFLQISSDPIVASSVPLLVLQNEHFLSKLTFETTDTKAGRNGSRKNMILHWYLRFGGSEFGNTVGGFHHLLSPESRVPGT